MANPTIVDYIKKQTSVGFSESQIRQALSKAGWFENEIEDAFASLKAAPVVKPLPEKPLPEVKPEPVPVVKPAAEKPKEVPKVVEQKKPSEPLIKAELKKPDDMVSKPRTSLIPIILSVIGGALLVLNSALFYLEMGDILDFIIQGFNFSLLSDIGLVSASEVPIIGLVLGIGLLINAVLIKIGPEISRSTSILMIVLGVVGILIGNGFLIGSVIGIVGGIVGIVKRS
jgi:hypothetical protein